MRPVRPKPVPTASDATGADAIAAARRVAERHGRRPAELLQILIALQAELGHLPRAALAAVGQALGRPLGDVEAVAGFYRFLHLKPAGRYRLLLSDNITDRMAGSQALLQQLCAALGVAPGQVSADGRVSVDHCSCIGLGDQGPALLVNHQTVVTRLDAARIQAVAAAVLADRPLADWPAHLPAGAMDPRAVGLPPQAHPAAHLPTPATGPLLAPPPPLGEALRAGLQLGPAAVLQAVGDAKLRGRGGAGFATHTKWQACAQAPIRHRDARSQHQAGLAPHRHIVCNADEGEPGTFKDRVLLTERPQALFDGMTLAALAVGARHGWVYLRGEYTWMLPALQAALAERRASGLLGHDIGGRVGFDFDIRIHLGAGAYVCGEETALLESLEGQRGVPRHRPPYPTSEGLFGQPTVVNNVETLCAAAAIVHGGAARWAAMGTAESTGSKLHSISGDCDRPGVYEMPLGTTVRELLSACGAPDAAAVQVGGPSGNLLGQDQFDRRIAFEDLPSAGAFMVFGPQRDPFDIAHNFSRFFAHESCGFCTPCRVGSQLVLHRMDRLASGQGRAVDLADLPELAHLMHTHAHCGLGHTAGRPVTDAMAAFPLAFERRLAPPANGPTDPAHDAPAFDLDAHLLGARRAIQAQATAADSAPQ